MTSDPGELDPIAVDEDEEEEPSGEGQAPSTTVKKKRGRLGDTEGDESLRPVKKIEYPGVPPQFEENPLLKLFSDQAIGKVAEYGRLIIEDVVAKEEDPQFFNYFGQKLEESGYTHTDVTKIFKETPITRHRKRNYKPKKSTSGSLTEKGVSDSLTSFYKTELGATTNTRTGFFGKAGTIEGGRQNFTEIMDIDLISLFSQTVITYLKESKQKITEIQAMVFPDRVFVSANEKKALELLVGKKLSDVLEVARTYRTTKTGTVMHSTSTGEPIPVVDDERNARADIVRDLTKVFAGTEPSAEMFKYLTTVLVSVLYSPEQADAVVSMFSTFDANKVFIDATGATSGAALAPFISGPTYANKIIVIGSGENCHAEQNLLIAVARSGYTGPATIGGGKRPCQTCSCAFILVNELKNDQIVWYERPGGAWGTSTKKSFATLANLLKIELAEVKKIAKKLLVEDGQFATAFDADTPDRVLTTGFGKEVTTKVPEGQETTRADRIPRPQRLPSEIFTGVEEYVPSPLSSQDSTLSIGEETEIPEDELAGLKEDQEQEDIEKLRDDLSKFADDAPLPKDESESEMDTDEH
jgi:hypothetical protein